MEVDHWFFSSFFDILERRCGRFWNGHFIRAEAPMAVKWPSASFVKTPKKDPKKQSRWSQRRRWWWTRRRRRRRRAGEEKSGRDTEIKTFQNQDTTTHQTKKKTKQKTKERQCRPLGRRHLALRAALLSSPPLFFCFFFFFFFFFFFLFLLCVLFDSFRVPDSVSSSLRF